MEAHYSLTLLQAEGEEKNVSYLAVGWETFSCYLCIFPIGASESIRIFYYMDGFQLSISPFSSAQTSNGKCHPPYIETVCCSA